MTGYRKLLASNIPKTWDLALRWCGCKTYWIEYVYKQHIGPFNKNCLCTRAQNNKRKGKKVLSIVDKKSKFADSIKWDSFRVNPTDEKRKKLEMWVKINDWVLWFEKNYIYIENIIHIDKEVIHAKESKTFDRIMKYTKNNEKLTKFLVKNIC